jgi:hypothetical protein
VAQSVSLQGARSETSAALFAAVAVSLAVVSAGIAGWAPIGFSIATVFLFAGPHNWLEFRYFLNRMPARWGPLRGFFLLAIAGAIALTAGFAMLPWLAGRLAWQREGWDIASASWNSALILWIAALIHLRGREGKERDWSWIWCPAGLLAAVIWLVPWAWEIALVYLHPLIAMVFLQRVLRKQRPEWLPAFYACLACVPLLLAVLWLRLAAAPPLPGTDALTLRITHHAGGNVVGGVSTHFLVAAHTFLEMLHYGVWIVAVPLLAMKTAPWRLQQVPLAQRSGGWRNGVRVFLGCGAVVVVLLWACFLADYPTTRDVYFTAAILHVLAEFPFLIRTL